MLTHSILMLRTVISHFRRCQRRRRPGVVGIQLLEPRCLLSATIRGRVWNDVNANGHRNDGEGYLKDVVVEAIDRDGNIAAITTTQDLDRNDDGVIDESSETGWYSLEDLDAGTYIVRQANVSLAGQTVPQWGRYRGVSDTVPGHEVHVGPGDLREVANLIGRQEATPGITVRGGRADGSLVVKEGSTAIAYLSLNTQPSGPVQLRIESPDSHLQISPAELTFSPDDWNRLRTIAVNAPEDALWRNGNKELVVSVQSADDSQDAQLEPLSFPFTVIENDIRIQGRVWNDVNRNGEPDDGESGLNDRPIEVRLGRQVISETLTQSVDVNLDGAIDPITETGFYRFDIQEEGYYYVVHAAATPRSQTSGHRSFYASPGNDRSNITFGYNFVGFYIPGSNDDVPAFELSENDEQDLVPVVLDEQPVSDVIIRATAADGAPFVVTSADLTFTPENWDTQQFVRVAGVDDSVVTDHRTGQLQLSVPAAEDARFRTAPQRTVDLTVLDTEIRIQGRVWNDTNGNGQQDAGEDSLNGQLVELTASDGSVLYTSTTIDVDLNDDGEISPPLERGVYLFDAVPIDEYHIRAEGLTPAVGFQGRVYDRVDITPGRADELSHEIPVRDGGQTHTVNLRRFDVPLHVFRKDNTRSERSVFNVRWTEETGDDVTLDLSVEPSNVFQLSSETIRWRANQVGDTRRVTVTRRPVALSYDTQATVTIIPRRGNEVFDSVEFDVEVGNDQTLIEGRYWADIDGDGEFGANDIPLNNATITMYKGRYSSQSISASTQSLDRNGDGQIDPHTETGWYQFIDPPPGRYYPKHHGNDVVTASTTTVSRYDFPSELPDYATHEGGTVSIPIRLKRQPTSEVTLDVTTVVGDIVIGQPTITFLPENWNVTQRVRLTTRDNDLHQPNEEAIVQIRASIDNELEDGDVFAHTIVRVRVIDNESSLSGRVVLVDYVTGEYDHQVQRETGVDEVTVTLTHLESGRIFETKTTSGDRNNDGTITSDEAGWYSFDHIPAGQYLLKRDEHPVLVQAGIAAAERDLGLYGNPDVLEMFRHFVNRLDVEFQGDLKLPENGGSVTVNVRLNSAPRSKVVVAVTTGLPEILSLSKPELTFNSENWNTFQSVLVETRNNDVTDAPSTPPWGLQRYEYTDLVNLRVDESESGVDFHGSEYESRRIIIVDDDFTVSGYVVDSGASHSSVNDPFSILSESNSATIWNGQNDVRVRLIDSTGRLVAETRTFPEEREVAYFDSYISWDGVGGVDDDDDFIVDNVSEDGTSAFDGSAAEIPTLQYRTIVQDGRFEFPGVEAGDYLLKTDTNQVRMTVGPQASEWTTNRSHENVQLHINGSRPVSLTEGQEQTSSFSRTADFRPDHQVVYTIASSQPDRVAVSPAELVFTPDNWDVQQAVSLIASDDDLVGSSPPVAVTVSVDQSRSDSSFHDFPDVVYQVLVKDNEPAANLVVTSEHEKLWEWGGTKPVLVSLSHPPAQPVHVDVRSERRDGRINDVEVSNGSLVFTSDNWNVPQEVLVRAARDGFVDGNNLQNVMVSVTDLLSPEAFHDVSPKVVTFTTYDTDRLRIEQIHGDEDPTPKIAWTPHYHAVSHHIQLQRIGESGNVFQDKAFAGNSLQLSSDLVLGRYRVWIAANLSDGTRTGWNSMTFSYRPQIQQHDIQQNAAGELIVSWDSLPGATGYRVFVRNTLAGQSGIIGGTVDTDSLNIGQFGAGATRVWVQAVDPTGLASRWSTPQQIVASKVQLVGPTGVAAAGRQTFSWTALAGISRYELYIKQSSGRVITEIVEGNSTTLDREFILGTHKWWVRPVGESGQKGRWSDTGSFTVGTGIANVRAIPIVSDSLFRIEWNAVEGAEGYIVSIGGLNPVRVGTTSFSTGLLSARTYRIWVKPIDEYGDGNWSQPTELVVRRSSLTVTGLAATPERSSQPELAWNPVPEAASYDILLRWREAWHHDWNSTWGEYQAITDIATATYNVPTTLDHGEWEWRVRPRFEDGTTGSWSDTSIIQSLGRTQIQDVTISAGIPRITWQSVAFASTYHVWISEVTGSHANSSLRPFDDFRIEDNYYEPEAPLPAGCYRIWVSALRTPNSPWDWSDSVDFVIAHAS